MRLPLRHDFVAGAVAGLLGGLLLGWVHTQGPMMAVAGFAGATRGIAGALFHLLLSSVLGATFGVMFRQGTDSYPATISGGILFGLLWWIVGPLTLVPLLAGAPPSWSLIEAAAVFPTLIGTLLYGGTTGAVFCVLTAVYSRVRPADRREAGAVEAPVPVRRVVILGGGFGGVSTAQRLVELFSRQGTVEATLVSASNYLLFTPMLAEVASSALEPQHISSPVRAAAAGMRFRRADVESIDTEKRVVHLRTSPEAPPEAQAYDHLVLALGAVPNFYGLPGVEENAFTLKSLEDATALRNHVIALLERAGDESDPVERRRLLTFVVAGGGFAGTEMIAELFDLAHSVLRYYPHIDPAELRFVLVHGGDRILPELSPELGAYAREKLSTRGIEFRLGARVAGATPVSVLLGDGTEVSTRTLVWTAGNQPNPLLRTLPCERSRSGAVVVDSALQVKGHDNLWAVGDCAQIPDPVGEGKFYPPTAQHALREGAAVADNIAAVLRGRNPIPFRFRTIGTLVALGHRTAVAEVRGWKFSGFLAWMMWRAVYLGKLPGLEKKVRVALDWTLDLFFPRDIVLTGNATRPISPRPGSAPERAEPLVVKVS